MILQFYQIFVYFHTYFCTTIYFLVHCYIQNALPHVWDYYFFFYVEKVNNYIYESVNTVLRIQSNVQIVVHTIRVVILLW